MRDEDHGGSLPNERFRVEPGALRALATDIGELADGAGEARTYATGNLLLTNGGGSIILALNELMYDLEGTMDGFFGDLGEVLRDSEQGLRDAATMYRTTDAEAAKRLDASYWSR